MQEKKKKTHCTEKYSNLCYKTKNIRKIIKAKATNKQISLSLMLSRKDF